MSLSMLYAAISMFAGGALHFSLFGTLCAGARGVYFSLHK